jgi:hypothetical protein
VRALRAAPALAEAAVVVTAVEIGLRTLRLPTLARACGLLFDPADPAPSDAPAGARLTLSPRTARRLKAVLLVLARGPFADTCLRRALAMGSVLRSRDPRLLVGVTRRDGKLLAHAWLVVDGVNLDPMTSRGYAPLTAAAPAVAA